jgi:hypothetical protein
VGETGESRELDPQELATPEVPVRSIAQTVESQRQRRSLASVLEEARDCVGVVVLHGHTARRELARESGTDAVRVEIVCGKDRCRAREARELRDPRLRGFGGCDAREVSDVLADHELSPQGESGRALQVSAQRDHRGVRAQSAGQRQHERRRPA